MIKRIASNVITRVAVGLILAAIFAWFGTGKAHAQNYSNCHTTFSAGNCQSEGEAFTVASTLAQSAADSLNTSNPSIPHPVCPAVLDGPYSSGGYSWKRWTIRVGNGSCSAYAITYQRSFLAVNTCASRASYTGSINSTSAPSLETCKGGCTAKGNASGIDDQWISDGTYDETPGLWVHTTFTYSGATCTVEPAEEKPECPAGQHRNDKGVCVEQGECPVGQSMIGGVCTPDGKCPTGKIKGPDGSCVDESCPAGKAKGKDGTCKVDADGDGQPDDEEEGNEEGNKFSGGDSCDSPPSCSGDAILCGQARIQWRIDCNTRRDRNIVGGSCDAMPICVGKNCDALEYSQLLMQWRTSCKADGGTTPGGEEGQPEWTKVTGMSQDGGAGSSPDDTKVLSEKELTMADVDTSGTGGAAGGSCPALFIGSAGTGIESEFIAALASPSAEWCGWIGNVHAVIILLAGVGCCFIMASGGKA